MSSGKVKCTCGWSWNKSDSSKKDMYICHECGRDNSNNMKNGGWLDNYNDSEVSLPEGYVGEGYDTTGRNYSPAWGGQFEDGGSVYPVNYVPQAQWGLPVGPLTPLALSAANKVKSWWNDDEPVKPIKPIKKPATQGKARTLNIVDPRKKMATTNQPLRPNSDLVGGKYNSKHLDKLMQEAKRQKLSKQDMMTLSAMGFQETKWGKSDGNIGHVIGNWKGNDYYQKFISAYKEKMKEADRLGITDPATRLQVYNGMGTVTPKTEKNYHRFEMQKIYGVPIPKGGINMKKNPLYGKQVMDIRDNVLAKNPEYLQYMDSIYKAPVPAYMQDVRMNKQKPPKNIQGRPQLIQPLLAPLKKKEMGGSIPGAVGFSYARTNDPAPDNGPGAKKTMASAQGGKKVQSKEKKWLGNTLTPEGWVTSTTKGGNRISFTGDIRVDDWINKQIDSGKFGFDPKTESTFPLKKPVKGLSKEMQFMATKQYHDLRAPEGFTNESQQAQIDKLPEWQQDMLNAENTKRRKRVVYNSMQDAVKNPLFYAPGAIALAPIAAAGLTEAGILASPYIESALATQLPGMATVPGATVGNAITAGFAGHGLANIGPDSIEMYENPSWENAFNVGMDVAESLPVISPAIKTIGEGMSASRKALGTEEGLLSNVNKLNPFAKTAESFNNPNSFYRQIDTKTFREGVDSGLIKGKQDIGFRGPESGSFNLNKSFGDDAYYNKGSLYSPQRADYIYEVKKGEEAFIPKVNNRTRGYTTENTSVRVSKEPIPLEEATIYKKHWLQGYKQIPKQEDGGVIKDDMGQWAHPGEITEIGSNQITMQGVPYPVLGISDTGDIQMMYPEEDYEFDGESVTEYPMAKNGIRQEQKGLVNLDQLTNFTNYNKPQPGGWLNKYN